jgi:NAD(P)-dependent dehydrogenase (short-subunit alcohol dehydrogenase family)
MTEARICVVTGAAAGLGLATAEAFCGRGDTVILVDRDGQRGRTEAERLGSHLGIAEFEQVDVSDEDAVEALAGRIQLRYGRVDILVNNAGVALREGDVRTLTRTQWDLTIRVNLTSVYLMSHYLVPLMPEGSCIVNVATTGVLRSVPGTDAYLAAKGGVVSLSKAMAVSLAEQRIRVNVVCPGAVLTAEVAGRADDPRVQRMQSRLGEPLGRGLGQPEEVSSVIEFLCTPGAAYLNGAVIPVDGGSVA